MKNELEFGLHELLLCKTVVTVLHVAPATVVKQSKKKRNIDGDLFNFPNGHQLHATVISQLLLQLLYIIEILRLQSLKYSLHLNSTTMNKSVLWRCNCKPVQLSLHGDPRAT